MSRGPSYAEMYARACRDPEDRSAARERNLQAGRERFQLAKERYSRACKLALAGHEGARAAATEALSELESARAALAALNEGAA